MVKMVRSSLVVALAFGAFAQAAHARDFASIYTDCGLGAMIAPTNSAVAAVTNVTFDLGTTAISSNVSSPETCKGGKGKTAMFIHESYDALASDISRGNGKYLDTLASLNGWAPEAREAITSDLRKGFADVVAKNGYTTSSQFQKSEALFNLVAKYDKAIS